MDMSSTDRPDDLIPIADAAREVGCARTSLYAQASAGRLELYATVDGPLRRLVSRSAVTRLHAAGWLRPRPPRAAQPATVTP